jgi:hypothetical protein
MLLFQFPGVAEEWPSANQWTNFRTLFRHPDEDDTIADLEANSSLTPGLKLLPGHREPGVLQSALHRAVPIGH